MDEKIQAAIDSAYALEREYGFERLDAVRADATFVAVSRLADTQDAAILAGCPDWLVEELHQWIDLFRKTGKFGFISNLGESDHSALMRRIAPLFDELDTDGIT